MVKHMNYFYTLLIAVFAITPKIQAQTIESLVKSIPSSILYGVNDTSLNILVQNPDDSLRTISTMIYPNIKRLSMDDSQITLQVSDARKLSIALLPLINDTKIVCVVDTYCGTICDSSIRFFDEKWLPITNSQDLLTNITQEMFFKEGTDLSNPKYKSVLDRMNKVNAYSYTISDADNKLLVTIDPKSYLTKEEYKDVEEVLDLTPKTLTWNKVKFTF